MVSLSLFPSCAQTSNPAAAIINTTTVTSTQTLPPTTVTLPPTTITATVTGTTAATTMLPTTFPLITTTIPPATTTRPPPTTTWPLTTRPAPGGSISGHICQADGVTPMAGVWVYAYQMYTPNDGGARTAADGSYKITNLAAAKYRVYAAFNGYVMEFYNETINAGQSSWVDVTVPNDTPNININLDPGGAISGHVYQADGATPIPGAKVYADIIGQGFFRWVVAEADGGYVIPDLPAKSYRIYAEADRHITEYYSGTYNSNQAAPVTVIVPNNTSGIDFKLETGGTISGHIYQPDGTTPVSYAHVYARMVNNAFTAGSYTASDGSYTTPGLPSGTYNIYVEASGYVREYYKDASSPGLAATLNVIAPDSLANIDISLKAGAPVTTGATPITTTKPLTTTYPPTTTR